MSAAGKMRNARINQAKKHASELLECLTMLSGHQHRAHVDQKDNWHDARNALERLTQCVHEANAYNNAMEPRS